MSHGINEQRDLTFRTFSASLVFMSGRRDCIYTTNKVCSDLEGFLNVIVRRHIYYFDYLVKVNIILFSIHQYFDFYHVTPNSSENRYEHI